jgi:hypothetical protein
MHSLVTESHELSQASGNARSQTRPLVLDVELNRGEVFTLYGDWRGVQIVVPRGLVWITQEGDPDDHFVAAGVRFTVTCAGRVVMQGIRT